MKEIRMVLLAVTALLILTAALLWAEWEGKDVKILLLEVAIIANTISILILVKARKIR